jgi:hypothetical protein
MGSSSQLVAGAFLLVWALPRGDREGDRIGGAQLKIHIARSLFLSLTECPDRLDVATTSRCDYGADHSLWKHGQRSWQRSSLEGWRSFAFG